MAEGDGDLSDSGEGSGSRENIVRKKAKEFDNLIACAHRRKYEPPENEGLKLLGHIYAKDIAAARQGEKGEYRRKSKT